MLVGFYKYVKHMSTPSNMQSKEHSGSVVDCLTRGQGVVGDSVLCPYPRICTCSTQEGLQNCWLGCKESKQTKQSKSIKARSKLKVIAEDQRSYVLYKCLLHFTSAPYISHTCPPLRVNMQLLCSAPRSLVFHTLIRSGWHKTSSHVYYNMHGNACTSTCMHFLHF